MKFKKEILEQILISIFEEHKYDNKKQDAFTKIFDIISQDSNNPYIEIDKAGAMLKIIGILNKYLEEEISHWLYDATSFWERGEGVKITSNNNGKEFNIKNQKEAIQFILNECDFIED